MLVLPSKQLLGAHLCPVFQLFSMLMTPIPLTLVLILTLFLVQNFQLYMSQVHIQGHLCLWVPSTMHCIHWLRFLVHRCLPRSRQFRVNRGVSCTNGLSMIMDSCIIHLESGIFVSGPFIFFSGPHLPLWQVVTHGNIDLSGSWLALELTYKVIYTSVSAWEKLQKQKQIPESFIFPWSLIPKQQLQW